MNTYRRSRILVSSLITVPLFGGDMGRYVAAQVVGQGNLPIGKEYDFFTGAGAKVSGKVIDMSEEIAAGHFPEMSGIVVDTRPERKEQKQVRMQSGGMAGPQYGVSRKVAVATAKKAE